MKKLVIFSIALVAISFASCKKDYTCTCTGSFGSSYTTKITGVSKKGAQGRCVSGTRTSGSYSDVVTCTLSK
jgi:hypothetical protein